jgi:hypothetical protein
MDFIEQTCTAIKAVRQTQAETVRATLNNDERNRNLQQF